MIIWSVLALAGALVLGGCGVRVKGGGALEPEGSAGAGSGLGGSGGSACVFEPVLLTVHPLTRLTRSADGTGRADVHFELFDRFGHPVKALGDVVVELNTRPTAALGGLSGEQIGLWGADLMEPTTNADAYDPVTRTYRIRIAAMPTTAWLDETVEVQVRFAPTGGDGRSLRGVLVVEVPRG